MDDVMTNLFRLTVATQLDDWLQKLPHGPGATLLRYRVTECPLIPDLNFFWGSV
jgi:hypothetical protein